MRRGRNGRRSDAGGRGALPRASLDEYDELHTQLAQYKVRHTALTQELGVQAEKYEVLWEMLWRMRNALEPEEEESEEGQDILDGAELEATSDIRELGRDALDDEEKVALADKAIELLGGMKSKAGEMMREYREGLATEEADVQLSSECATLRQWLNEERQRRRDALALCREKTRKLNELVVKWTAASLSLNIRPNTGLPDLRVPNRPLDWRGATGGGVGDQVPKDLPKVGVVDFSSTQPQATGLQGTGSLHYPGIMLAGAASGGASSPSQQWPARSRSPRTQFKSAGVRATGAGRQTGGRVQVYDAAHPYPRHHPHHSHGHAGGGERGHAEEIDDVVRDHPAHAVMAATAPPPGASRGRAAATYPSPPQRHHAGGGGVNALSSTSPSPRTRGTRPRGLGGFADAGHLLMHTRCDSVGGAADIADATATAVAANIVPVPPTRAHYHQNAIQGMRMSLSAFCTDVGMILHRFKKAVATQTASAMGALHAPPFFATDKIAHQLLVHPQFDNPFAEEIELLCSLYRSIADSLVAALSATATGRAVPATPTPQPPKIKPPRIKHKPPAPKPAVVDPDPIVVAPEMSALDKHVLEGTMTDWDGTPAAAPLVT